MATFDGRDWQPQVAGGLIDNTNPPEDLSVFWKLRDMFPLIDQDYLKALCTRDQIANNGSPEDRLAALINQLLAYGNGENREEDSASHSFSLTPSASPNRDSNDFDDIQQLIALQELSEQVPDDSKNDQLFQEFLGLDEVSVTAEQHEMLVRAFPNADPEMLLEIVRENHHDPERLQLQIEIKLMNGHYKTRSEYEARKRSQEQTTSGRVTETAAASAGAGASSSTASKLNLDEFLAKYPDPFGHFEKRQRKCEYRDAGLGFLQKRYVHYEVNQFY